MRREEMEQLLVGYIYGELGADEREAVLREIERDPEWAKVLEELRSASGILRKWEDEEPAVRHMVASPPPPSPRPGRTSRSAAAWRRFAPGAIAVAAALLLVAFNARFDYEEGRLGLSLGRAPEPERIAPAGVRGGPLDLSEAPSPYVTEEDFVRSQAELVRFVAALLEESEGRQSDRFLTALAQYGQEWQAQREGDLVFMDRRLGVVEDGARDLLDRVSADFPVSELRSRGGETR